MGKTPALMRCTWLSVLILLLVPLSGLGSTGATPAPPTERYLSVPPSADGIGRAYRGREIARMMGFDGAAWLERTERQKEERADLLMAELGLKPGMNVADVGAGTGYYSRRMALQVGPQGKIFAVEVQPQMLQVLETTAKRPGYGNIVPVLGAEDDVKLPEASVDLAIMVDVYHELAYPQEVLASIVRAVRPGGRVVFVEYRGEDFSVPIKTLHKMTEQQVRLEAADQALVWERTARTLPWQHVVVFKRP